MFNAFYMCMVFNMLSTTTHFMLPSDSVTVACENAQSIITVSEEENINPFILSALVFHESRFMPQAKSPAGACGLTQVMPKYVPPTCKQLQNDVELSLQTGAIILSMWLEKKKTYKIALQCYNSGYKCKNKTYANNILKTAKILEKTYNLTRRKMENALN
jgi:hypothetical protein